MHPRHRRAALLAGAVGLAALLAVPTAQAAVPTAQNPTPAAQAATPPACVGATEAGGANDSRASSFYEGPAASRTYDREFERSFAIPHLPDYIPQGMTTWQDWDGDRDLLLIGLYRGSPAENEQSLIAAVDARTGRHIGSVRLRNAHLGGIAVAGEFLYAQDAASRGRENVRRYRLSSLREGLKEAARTGDRPFIGRLKDLQEIHSADFMTTHDGKVWAGRYSERDVDRMYEYRVGEDGRLEPTGAAYPIPPRTQGALVTDRAFVFNTTNHSRPGVLVVTERSRSTDRDEVCFASPSMGEGMALVGDDAFNLFEGASYKYPRAANRVRDLHVASMQSLERLLRD
ncbi:MAG: hypothetical protein ACT4QF_00525 [Sporichthyaceae bacterium]